MFLARIAKSPESLSDVDCITLVSQLHLFHLSDTHELDVDIVLEERPCQVYGAAAEAQSPQTLAMALAHIIPQSP